MCQAASSRPPDESEDTAATLTRNDVHTQNKLTHNDAINKRDHVKDSGVAEDACAPFARTGQQMYQTGGRSSTSEEDICTWGFGTRVDDVHSIFTLPTRRAPIEVPCSSMFNFGAESRSRLETLRAVFTCFCGFNVCGRCASLSPRAIVYEFLPRAHGGPATAFGAFIALDATQQLLKSQTSSPLLPPTEDGSIQTAACRASGE